MSERSVIHKAAEKKRLIACRVFEDALRFLEIPRRFPDVTIRFLPAHLHLRPDELKKRISGEIAEARRCGATPICLYGQCFPGIGHLLGKLSVPRVQCSHCFEIFLGANRYAQLIDAAAGTFFLEKHLLLDFEESCWKPLELDDPMLRAEYFAHYRKLVYIRQPLDPEILQTAESIAARLELAFQVEDADYRDLEKRLIAILEGNDS